MNNSKSVVVTGASGHLGQALIRTLSANHSITPVSRGAVPENRAWKPYSSLSAKDFDCDLVIHAAAAHPRARTKPELKDYLEGNVDLLKRVLDLAAEGGARRFVFISSHYLNQNELLGWNRSEMPLYAATKLIGETLVKEYQNRIPLCVCLRLPGLLSPTLPASSFLVDVLSKLRNGQEVQLTNQDKPFEFVDGHMVAEWTSKLLECDEIQGYFISTVHSQPVWVLQDIVSSLKKLLKNEAVRSRDSATARTSDLLSEKMGFSPLLTEKVMSRFVQEFLEFNRKEG